MRAGLVWIACAAFGVLAQPATAAEIRLLAGSAIEPAMAELIPKFEQASGHTVSFDFDGAIGAMTERIRRGEAADVVIVSAPQIDSLAQQDKVASGSRVDIAKVGIGLFVRKGARKPDIATVEAFKQTMLAARSIGWNDPAAGAPVSIYMLGALERLGIAEAMRPKTVTFQQRTERFAPVARGEVEIGFNQISEIIVAPGVELLGPLPPPIQHHTLFAGGIVATSQVPDAGIALLRFVAAPPALAVWQAKGFEHP